MRTIPERNIWSNLKRHDEKAEWLANLGNSCEQCLTEITKAELQENLREMSSWKAPAPDRVQDLWMEH